MNQMDLGFQRIPAPLAHTGSRYVCYIATPLILLLDGEFSRLSLFYLLDYKFIIDWEKNGP